MYRIQEWRGHDLTKKMRKIDNAFNLKEVKSADEIPLVINTPCYFGFGNHPMPFDYWTNPASMVRFQENAFERHLSKVEDDTIPYFMPWFGTGVIASAFGCKIKDATGFGDDPGVISTCISSVKDIAKLKIPDACKDGLMPKVLKFMDYARENSDLPVGLTDMNSPLCTAAQMCGYDNLFVWMYQEPEAVRDLFHIIEETFISWVKIQKGHNGERHDQSNGLQGLWTPEGIGVWVSDDDLVSVDPELYEEFIVPVNGKIFESFGGGFVHFCGNGLHQINNLIRTRNIRAVNNSPMGDFETFGKLTKGLAGRMGIIIQDAAPIDVEGYYTRLFNKVDDLRGIILATFVEDTLGLTNEGRTMNVEWDPLDTANRIVKTIRECVRLKLAGEEPTIEREKPKYL